MPSVAPLHNKRNKHANLRDKIKILSKLTGSNSRCEHDSSTTSQKLVSGSKFWAESKPGSLVRRRPQRRRSRIWFSTPDTVPYLPPQKYKILYKIIRYTKNTNNYTNYKETRSSGEVTNLVPRAEYSALPFKASFESHVKITSASK